MSNNTSNAIIPNMDGRQEPKYIKVAITVAMFVAAGNVIEIALPENAEVIDGSVTVNPVFTTTGTDTIVIGDSAVANRYLASTSLKSAARTALTRTGFQTTQTNKQILIARTPADADATTGTIYVNIGYLQTGRSESTQD